MLIVSQSADRRDQLRQRVRTVPRVSPYGRFHTYLLSNPRANFPLRTAPMLDLRRFFWECLLRRGDVAQLGERLVRNEEVRGSNPLISTIILVIIYLTHTQVPCILSV